MLQYVRLLLALKKPGRHLQALGRAVLEVEHVEERVRLVVLAVTCNMQHTPGMQHATYTWHAARKPRAAERVRPVVLAAAKTAAILRAQSHEQQQSTACPCIGPLARKPREWTASVRLSAVGSEAEPPKAHRPVPQTTSMCACTHAHTHARVHTHTHTRTHTRARTRTRIYSRSCGGLQRARSGAIAPTCARGGGRPQPCLAHLKQRSQLHCDRTRSTAAAGAHLCCC